MAEYETEEQQVEALKQWWADNGRSIIFGVVLGLGAIFGWRGWQDHQTNQAEGASLAYSQLSEYVEEKAYEKASEQFDAIKSDYSSTPYAELSGLMIVRAEIEQKQLDEAEKIATWVVNNATQSDVKRIAQIRLARLQHALGRTDSAIATLDKIDLTQAYTGQIEELRGDLYLAQGEKAKARDAYSRAKASNTVVEDARLLQIKLDDLAMPTAVEQPEKNS